MLKGACNITETQLTELEALRENESRRVRECGEQMEGLRKRIAERDAELDRVRQELQEERSCKTLSESRMNHLHGEYEGDCAFQEPDSLSVKVGGDAEDPQSQRTTGDNRIKSTKYTLLTFLLRVLCERIAIPCFVMVAILSAAIIGLVPTMASLVPLVYVIAVTSAKRGYEDFVRHHADNVVNFTPVTVIRHGHRCEIRCQDIRPGDIVEMARDRDVPCDLILLQTSDENGRCYVTTANLDGETNLKTMSVPKGVPDVPADRLHTIGRIVYEPSNTNLYCFNGRIELADSYVADGHQSVLPLMAENLVLRGSRIKNTEWALGCAVYTGQKTKLAMNSKLTTNKTSSSERFINKYLVFFLVLLVAIVTVSCFLKRYNDRYHAEHNLYLGEMQSNYRVSQFLQDFFSFLILFNYLTPISLYATIETVKLIGRCYILWDLDLYDEEADQPCIVNTSDINEELGQVSMLFSDTTGTLTKNVMIFQQCSINGRVYEQLGQRLCASGRGPGLKINELPSQVFDFYQAMAVCHTVQVQAGSYTDEPDTSRTMETAAQATSNGLPTGGTVDLGGGGGTPKNWRLRAAPELNCRRMDYQASSPDEKALVEACARMGIVYTGDDGDRMNLRLRASCVQRNVMSRLGMPSVEERVQFERLRVLEFTSERMSVIVRDQHGQIWLYTKGAESHVLPLCRPSPLITTTQQHINEFAKLGLRTLAITRRRLTAAEYRQFNEELIEASSSLVDRQAKIEECQRKIETDLELLGATAVEDALQDYVRDTLISLGKAGIKVWVLTGDKVETAYNIALSCGHIPEDSLRYFITDCKTTDDIQQHLDTLTLEMYRHPGRAFALLIDGTSLALALSLDSAKESFRDISYRCHAVLCCRLSPLQKSEVVALMKTAEGSPVTAAIGDGADDVSMIQEAHVGLGIVGREGRQAARCADYAFTNFHMLEKLLLVHGHYSSVRLSILVMYFFYKNLVFVGIQLFFQIHSLFSNQSVYDILHQMLYNVIYTALPVLVLALTEKPHDEATLLKNPHLYQEVAHKRRYSWNNFIGWMLLSIFHSAVIYFFVYAVWTINPAIYANWAPTTSFACYGTVLMITLVVVVNLKLLLEASHKTVVFIGSILLSIFGPMASSFICYLLPINYDDSMLHVYNNLLSSLNFWMLTIIILVAAFLPDMVMLARKAIDIKIGHIIPGGAKYRRRSDRIESTVL
ncbi:phospholipid-transporting ATPase IF-like [Anopheles bellator]|uniref:phospholipid-transporting ATPase IF-like n=1 Tax=Anopheles bellator TaxID=139047 RepID=UPI002649315E|nr:phospholipid-transporting ATPase IF-like [Anopheles bellator]